MANIINCNLQMVCQMIHKEKLGQKLGQVVILL